MLDQVAKQIVQFIQAHPHWAGLSAFLISMAESLPVLGFILPGSVTMGAIGALIGAGLIPGFETFLWAMIGAAIGDFTGYWLGFHFGPRARMMWPLKRYPRLLERGENFFRQHAGKSVFLGRFIGPLRPVMPLIASVMKMPIQRFAPICLIACIGWAPIYMLPGILLGASTTGGQSVNHLSFFTNLGLFTISIIAFFWFFHLAFEQFTKSFAPYTRRLMASLIVFLLLSYLTYSVFTQGWALNWNETLRVAFLTHRSFFLDDIAVIFTFLGNKEVLIVPIFLVFFWLLYKRDWNTAVIWMLNAALAITAAHFLKNWVHFPRPEGLMVHQPSASASFPSGHATLFTAVVGFLAILVAHAWPRIKRVYIYLVAASLIALMIISRLYLGAHWATDVAGGMLLGYLCTQICHYWYLRIVEPSEPFPIHSTLAAFLIGLFLGWSTFSMLHYKVERWRYTPKQLYPASSATVLTKTAHPSS